MAENLDRVLVASLAELKKLSTAELLDGRYEEVQEHGEFFREE